MSKFIIQGGERLRGDVEVSGMKNAALPIIAATLLTTEECIIDNVPQITDVRKMLEILESLGARAEWTDDHQVTISTQNANLGKIEQEKVKSMRASVLLLGPLLARFREVRIYEPGGCIIGKRPLDTHIHALRSLGAMVELLDEEYHLKANGLKGTEIVLPEFSVTATENAVMAAVLAEGVTIIKLAAGEPHVQDLIKFLNNMGAKIEGAGTHTLRIEGVKELRGAKHELIPDQIEIGTWAVAGAVTGGKINIHPVVPEHLDMVMLKFNEIGINAEIEGDSLKIRPSSNLKAFKLQSMPYPGFPTDLEAPFGLLATQCKGTSLLHDPLFESRMGYVNELIKMGANATICDPHRVLVTGPTPLYAREIRSYDLRAGATLLIAGLIAEGETVINEAEVVDRGYENIDERLGSLGAKFKRAE
ncbi:MAG: UDP-N-acetylglucosamine 1-carboxyvinyltransferase [Aliifodinibius sp.]|nr:UDP-N-acetylglucosamine 1-carboxyvinyltransferase [Phycisphaerae bacterium]NIT57168.1 UDP-N-acetylglucosamine 1-carboxyvinyltransferase [Fodinibius sp.]NIY25750.1 UDP-N-acetylglucosamine 1-carboxyvinyltransferase [Fodinibius sp.]